MDYSQRTRNGQQPKLLYLQRRFSPATQYQTIRDCDGPRQVSWSPFNYAQNEASNLAGSQLTTRWFLRTIGSLSVFRCRRNTWVGRCVAFWVAQTLWCGDRWTCGLYLKVWVRWFSFEQDSFSSMHYYCFASLRRLHGSLGIAENMTFYYYKYSIKDVSFPHIVNRRLSFVSFWSQRLSVVGVDHHNILQNLLS